MATSSNNTPAINAKTLGLNELKLAGVSSVQFGLATTVTVFAVQAAVVAGKLLLTNGKALVGSLKS